MRLLCPVLLAAFFVPCAQYAAGQNATAAQGQPAEGATKTLTVRLGEKVARQESEQQSLSATQQLEVSVDARLMQADIAAQHDGSLTLEIHSQFDDQKQHPLGMNLRPRLILALPLSSVADAYGESRACYISKEGAMTFVYTAGLDEDNFVPFAPAQNARDFHFLLNKYLCRALAAPFQCKGVGGPPIQQALPRDMSHWRVGYLTDVTLKSEGAPAKAAVSDVKLSSTGKPFDYNTCAKVAPSNGICCVAHKTTEWHCGGKPSGPGWHKVSGDCYHRETGGQCLH